MTRALSLLLLLAPAPAFAAYCDSAEGRKLLGWSKPTATQEAGYKEWCEKCGGTYRKGPNCVPGPDWPKIRGGGSPSSSARGSAGQIAEGATILALAGSANSGNVGMIRGMGGIVGAFADGIAQGNREREARLAAQRAQEQAEYEAALERRRLEEEAENERRHARLTSMLKTDGSRWAGDSGGTLIAGLPLKRDTSFGAKGHVVSGLQLKTGLEDTKHESGDVFHGAKAAPPPGPLEGKAQLRGRTALEQFTEEYDNSRIREVEAQERVDKIAEKIAEERKRADAAKKVREEIRKYRERLKTAKPDQTIPAPALPELPKREAKSPSEPEKKAPAEEKKPAGDEIDDKLAEAEELLKEAEDTLESLQEEEKAAAEELKKSSAASEEARKNMKDYLDKDARPAKKG